ncbi:MULTISPECIES: GH1 family beta-glucosidase [Gammaproteobacteria]|uniref:GH1 family beta-glucosidase n=1 Tax=Gammaproteobacteria TaxID=1236 RepID=UPI000DD0368D|nr:MULTISPECIES: GH1 family beta-glucosidase [Gammaproteobacteria]RTE86290.1 beta-glucosidase [Aliidiomarina sp. B3213]TCZ91641.1 beta-glucosidase [Lysobacter sp. N42]
MKKITLPKQSKLQSSHFMFGVATSSFQIEGSADTREPCIWDTFCSQSGRIKDGSNGIVACDHVAKWQEDVQLIANLGAEAYRFSIAWGRVINADGSVNRVGLDFYVKLVDALKAKGIAVHVTLYHWDLPQYLEDRGGWLNRETAYRFAEYAEVVVKALGDKVAQYSTINEPFCSAYLSYEAGIHAPGHKNRKSGRQAAHYLLLAHGLALPVLRKYAPNSEHGIVLNFSPCYPATETEADRRAALAGHTYHNLWYLQAILTGTYPTPIYPLKKDEYPEIEQGDMEVISQHIDFVGVNYYTKTVFREKNNWFSDVPATKEPLTTMGWEVYPEGFTEILVQLNETFDNLPPIYITENGAAFPDYNDQGSIHDIARIDYYQRHLHAVHDAIEAGVEIRGYFAWSLLDNFEWAEGYTQRFGIVYVDFETQERILKDSAKALRALWLDRKLQNQSVEGL